MATLSSKTSAIFIQPYLPLQHTGHTATFTIYVLSPTSLFGALLCSALMHLFGQMPLAELTNTAVTRQHEFYPREKTEVFGVSVTGAVDSSVYT